MKIKKAIIKNFKRFTDLTIENIPESVKLIILVGPNGSGKTSLFEAFNFWHRYRGFNYSSDNQYIVKKSEEESNSNWRNSVDIQFHDFENINDREQIKGKFYFRSAYRNEADFTINRFEKQDDPRTNLKLSTLMQNDQTVSENYQRLISHTLSAVYEESNNQKSVEELRNELIGKIRSSLSNIFDDLTLSSIGDPLEGGSFYFEKGQSIDFHYKNLSAGEKSAFDLILDIIIKSKYYENSVFFIDEPEAHMHTRLQAKLLRELYNLLPNTSQLWISTHSIGMLKEAEEIENNNPGTVVFLDFDNRDFDLTEVMQPAKINKAIWDKFFDLAFADFSNLIAPKRIVFCEGNPRGQSFKNFDAQVYGKIFESKYYDTKFLSIGSSSEIEDLENQSVNIVSKILNSSKIIKMVDRDDKSDEEVEELKRKGIITTSKRNIESYLFDDELIKKLCNSINKYELIEECLKIKEIAINNSIERGNPSDDIKSASGEIFVELKKKLGITQCGNNKSSFLRDTITPLITEDTEIYKEIENQIFKNDTIA